MIADNAWVLRMVWHPFHFSDDGELHSTAFNGDDLLAIPDNGGRPRYLSVDDQNIISQLSVDWRVAWQQRDGKREENERHDPKFVRFLAGSLRQCPCDEGRQMYELTREPTEEHGDGPGSPANPAHCGVKTLEAARYANLSKAKRKMVLNYMRVQLMGSIDEILEYRNVFPGAA